MAGRRVGSGRRVVVLVVKFAMMIRFFASTTMLSARRSLLRFWARWRKVCRCCGRVCSCVFINRSILHGQEQELWGGDDSLLRKYEKGVRHLELHHEEHLERLQQLCHADEASVRASPAREAAALIEDIAIGKLENELYAYLSPAYILVSSSSCRK